MSRASMSTSGAVFSDGNEQPIRPKATLTKPLRVAIIGDFSGRQSRGLCEPTSIAQRPAHRLTKDSFERVFERLGVSLDIPICEAPIAMMEFDDLHPDYIYSRVPLFKQFIELRKQLLNPSEFNQAADEIQTWAHFQAQSINSSKSDKEESQLMLDAILASGNLQQEYERSPQGQIDALIKDIVAPFVAPTTDPRQQDFLDAVAEATNDCMRKIMHQSAFQSLEASWRSLHMLIRRLESNANLYLDIIDISKEELVADLHYADNDLEKAQIFKRLVSSQTETGNMPYNLIVGDFFLEDTQSDIALLIDMATIAQSVEGCFISGADNKLAGCPSLAGSVDPDDWYYPLSDEFQSAWAALRDFDATEHVALAAPRFLLRLPYGKETATTDCFDFEELPAELGHKFYLWGNSAYMLALQLCESFNRKGPAFEPNQNPLISDLPLHVFKQHGNSNIKPCAEAMLTDIGASKFERSGLSVVRSVKNKDEVMIPTFRSLHTTERLLGPWNL